MLVPWLTHTLEFPGIDQAGPDGLLAVGGDLSTERLLLAYRSGIFPWYNSPPVLWWYPDPRFVLFPENLHVSKSMGQLMKKEPFQFTINEAFSEVMRLCGKVSRKGQRGTWISEEMIEAYSDLHRKGYAVSVEVWKDGALAGGLYGLRLGSVFFGESMFSLLPNASKAALLFYTGLLRKQKVRVIDCQVYTEHLASLGAGFISGKVFQQILRDALPR